MKTKLNQTKNDLPEETRRKMIDLLNQNLADIFDLRLQAEQAGRTLTLLVATSTFQAMIAALSSLVVRAAESPRC